MPEGPDGPDNLEGMAFQLVLQKEEVPTAQSGPHSRLGWNTWCRRKPYPRHAQDTVFTVADQVCINSAV